MNKVIKCVVCGKKFTPKNKKNITCSKECARLNDIERKRRARKAAKAAKEASKKEVKATVVEKIKLTKPVGKKPAKVVTPPVAKKARKCKGKCQKKNARVAFVEFGGADDFKIFAALANALIYQFVKLVKTGALVRTK